MGLKITSGETCMDSGGMKYLLMQSLNTFSTSRIFSGSMSRVNSVPRRRWYMVRMSVSQVPPERGAMARSITSAPAEMAAKLHATAIPAVSWVWNWISLAPLPKVLSRSSRAIFTVSKTVAGVLVPLASLKARESKGMPLARISFRRSM